MRKVDKTGSKARKNLSIPFWYQAQLCLYNVRYIHTYICILNISLSLYLSVLLSVSGYLISIANRLRICEFLAKINRNLCRPSYSPLLLTPLLTKLSNTLVLQI